MWDFTWKGWRKEPKDYIQEAYEFLTGLRKGPFIVVFGRPETLKNKSEKDLDDQAEKCLEIIFCVRA